VEAMILGIPCAVFRDGGAAVDIIGDSGLIVDNPEELAMTILEVKKMKPCGRRCPEGAKKEPRNLISDSLPKSSILSTPN